MSKLRWLLLIVWLGATLGLLKVAYDLPVTPSLPPAVSATQQAANRKVTPPAKQAPINNVDLTALAAAQKNQPDLLHNQMVGTLTVPSIQLSLPIMRAATDDAMMIGAAQYYPERQMGTGNYVLASHNMVAAAILMANIDQLQRGQKINVSDDRQTWTYAVSRNEVVEEHQMAVVANAKQPLVTLLRCEGGLNTTKRRIVQGTLVAHVKQPTAAVTPKLSGYQRSVQTLGQQGWLRQLSASLSQWLAGHQLGQAAMASVIWVAVVIGIWSLKPRRKASN